MLVEVQRDCMSPPSGVIALLRPHLVTHKSFHAQRMETSANTIPKQTRVTPDRCQLDSICPVMFIAVFPSVVVVGRWADARGEKMRWACGGVCLCLSLSVSTIRAKMITDLTWCRLYFFELIKQ